MNASAIFGVLPVKSLRFAKRRLADCLPEPARRALMRQLYLTAVRALCGVLPAARIAVVSHDATVLALAAAEGLRPLKQQSVGLNAAVREGETWALAAGAEALLVLLGDLPLVTPATLAGLLARSAGGREVILGRGQRGGTHALFVRPPGWLTFAFGGASCARYTRQAQRAGARLCIHDDPDLAFDIDLPEDWLRAASVRPELREATRDVLEVTRDDED